MEISLLQPRILAVHSCISTSIKIDLELLCELKSRSLSSHCLHKNYRIELKNILYSSSTFSGACENITGSSYIYNVHSRRRSEQEECQNIYPAVYLVAIFFAISLAFSALSSDNLFRTNPSPLHSEQIPEPPQSSQVFVGVCQLQSQS